MDASEIASLMLGVTAGWALTLMVCLATSTPDSVWQKKVIEAGHGEFNSTTAEFQFLPPCGEHK